MPSTRKVLPVTTHRPPEYGLGKHVMPISLGSHNVPVTASDFVVKVGQTELRRVDPSIPLRSQLDNRAPPLISPQGGPIAVDITCNTPAGQMPQFTEFVGAGSILPFYIEYSLRGNSPPYEVPHICFFKPFADVDYWVDAFNLMPTPEAYGGYTVGGDDTLIIQLRNIAKMAGAVTEFAAAIPHANADNPLDPKSKALDTALRELFEPKVNGLVRRTESEIKKRISGQTDIGVETMAPWDIMLLRSPIEFLLYIPGFEPARHFLQDMRELVAATPFRLPDGVLKQLTQQDPSDKKLTKEILKAFDELLTAVRKWESGGGKFTEAFVKVHTLTYRVEEHAAQTGRTVPRDMLLAAIRASSLDLLSKHMSPYFQSGANAQVIDQTILDAISGPNVHLPDESVLALLVEFMKVPLDRRTPAQNQILAAAANKLASAGAAVQRAAKKPLADYYIELIITEQSRMAAVKYQSKPEDETAAPLPQIDFITLGTSLTTLQGFADRITPANLPGAQRQIDGAFYSARGALNAIRDDINTSLARLMNEGAQVDGAQQAAISQACTDANIRINGNKDWALLVSSMQYLSDAAQEMHIILTTIVQQASNEAAQMIPNAGPEVLGRLNQVSEDANSANGAAARNRFTIATMHALRALQTLEEVR